MVYNLSKIPQSHQVVKQAGAERAKKLALIIHFSEINLHVVLSSLMKRKWSYKLHSLVKNFNPMKSSQKFNNDFEFWVVCWKSEDGELNFTQLEESDQR